MKSIKNSNVGRRCFSNSALLIGLALSFVVFIQGCLSTNMKQLAELDYEVPHSAPNPEGGSGNRRASYEPKAQFRLTYLDDGQSIGIDGDFSEWDTAPSIETQIDVMGGSYNPADGNAKLAIATNGTTLWFFLDVRDDLVEDNQYNIDQAYLSDSIDIYFSTRASRLRRELNFSEQLIRVISRPNDAESNVLIAINNRFYPKAIQAALVSDNGGYRVEFSIPLLLLSNKEKLKVGNRLQLSLQFNDADGNGRESVLHWVNPEDSSWRDFSAWGQGVVSAKASSVAEEAEEAEEPNSETEGELQQYSEPTLEVQE